MKRSHRVALVLVAYLILVVSLAIFRVGNLPPGDDQSRVTEIATGFLMVFATIGPALLADFLMRRLAPATQLTRTKRLNIRRVTKLQKKHRFAEHFMICLARDQQAWDKESERLRAVYKLAYRTALARLNARNRSGTMALPPTAIQGGDNDSPTPIQ